MFRFLEILFRSRRRTMPESPEAAEAVNWTRPTAPRHLAESEIRHIHEKWTCPYCQSSYGLFEGPRGGASLNLFCGNPSCDSRFNVIDPKFGCLPIGQFLGPCPPDFIERRRAEIRYADEAH